MSFVHFKFEFYLYL